MSMKCKKIAACLNAYVDGELSEKMSRGIEAHLTTCEVCRSRLEDIKRIDELFKTNLPVPPVPDRLAGRIMAEARKRKSIRISKRDSRLREMSPFNWFVRLSTPMKLAASVTIILSFATGFLLNRGLFIEQKVRIATDKDIYGFEWFAPAPPDSISSIYIAMDQLNQEGNVQ